jgi:hypothetical protein
MGANPCLCPIGIFSERPMTVQQFVDKHQITMTSERIDARPDRAMSDWDAGAFHFACTIRRGRESYALTYSMGSGHGKKAWSDVKGDWRIIPPTPDVASVLDSLRSDAQSTDNARDFEDWASDLGYDTDSRKAETTWRACVECARKLRFMLGDVAYAELMDCEPM